MKTKSSNLGWIAFICCILANLVYCGFVANQQGMLIEPVCSDLGLPRSLLSTLQSLTPLVNTVISLFFMQVMNKIGLKPMAILGGAGIVAFCVFYYLAGQITSAATAFIALAQICLGFNMAWATATTANIVIVNWFAERTGLLISMYATAGAVGGLVAAPLIGKILATSGWMTAVMYFGIASAIVLVIVLLLFKAKPGEGQKKIWEKEDAGNEGEAAELPGLTFAQARKTRNFWGSILVCVGLGIFLYPPFIVLAAFCADSGVPEIAGTAMSVVFAAQILCTLPLGSLVDKFGLKTVVLPIFLLYLAAMLAYAMAPGKGVIFFGAAVFGMGMALCNALVPLLTTSTFGLRDFAAIQTKFYPAMIIGMIIGPPIFNAVFDLFGSYNNVFLANAAAMILMVVFLFIATKKLDFSKYADSNV